MDTEVIADVVWKKDGGKGLGGGKTWGKVGGKMGGEGAGPCNGGGKDRGKGKGDDGCWNCGQLGHIARNCPKAKGKAKSEFSGYCNRCGKFGPMAKNCSNKPVNGIEDQAVEEFGSDMIELGGIDADAESKKTNLIQGNRS